MSKKIYRWLFVLGWFVLLPLALTSITISSLSTDPNGFPGDGVMGQVRWFVTEQKVPSLIIFFTLFEAVIYSLRYNLPWADVVGVAGRPGLPKESRGDFERAGQLLDEVERTLRKNKKDIDEKLSKDKREELDDAMQQLADAMSAKEFRLAEFEGAYDRAAEIAGKHLAPWQRGEVREYTESIVIAVGVALLLRAFVVEAFKIPSGSMLPTLQISDHIFVNKFTYGPTIPWGGRILNDLPPARGDVVVFEYPDENPNHPRQNYIKRTIALPGDTLETKNGHAIINGWEVPHCFVGSYTYDEETGYPKSGELFVEFLGEHSYLTMINKREEGESEMEGPFRVQPGEFYVLGDNRDSSSDSRRWRQGRGGGVPFENVKGRSMFVWLSFNENGSDLFGVTWDRLFTHVMGAPRLPKEAPDELTKGIERCLSARPRDTTPPAPKLSGN